MRIAWTSRRSFPGPGGIPTMMRAVGTVLARDHDLRVWAARIDDEPVTRMNTTLRAQHFSSTWIDGIEVRPIPHDPVSRLAATGLGALSLPGARRFVNSPLRAITAPPFVRALGRGFASVFEDRDLVHCFGGEHLNWAAGHAAKARGKPLVITPFAHPGSWGDDAQNAAFYRTADRVLALVPSEADVYVKLGVAPDRVAVTGVPATPLPLPSIPVREQHGIGSAPLVLFLGVKEPYKGYRLVLEAAARIRVRAPDARFAFVGPHARTSQAEFAALDDPRIVVRGTVPAAEVSSWLHAADVLVLPSTTEIFPIVILEAWQTATPVVAGRWWCADDVVTDGVNGFIVETDGSDALADAVATLLTDQPLRKKMGEAGARTVAERFTPEAVALVHLEHYRAVT